MNLLILVTIFVSICLTRYTYVSTFTLGYDAVIRDFIDSAQNLIMLPNAFDTSPMYGRVDRFKIYTQVIARVTLGIFRPTGDPDSYIYVGGISFEAFAGANTKTLTVNQHIGVHPGDVIGFHYNTPLIYLEWQNPCEPTSAVLRLGGAQSITTGQTYVLPELEGDQPCRMYSFDALITPCDPGYFFDVPRDACFPCPKGTYQSQPGMDLCHQCDSGYTTEHEMTVLSSQCYLECPAGEYFRMEEGTAVCKPCEQGTYQENTGSKNCTSCDEGQTTIETGSTSSSDCHVPCNPGSFFDLSEKICLVCPKGTYQSDTGMFFCVQCDEGYTTAQPGSVEASQCYLDCPAGQYYTMIAGSGVCKPCERGTYQENTGSKSCKSCDEGQTTPGTGSTSASDCQDDDNTDRDPHFMISSHGRHLCYDFDGYEQEILLLVDDRENDILINGELFETFGSTKEIPRSYFNIMAITVKDNFVKCSNKKLEINDVSYDWSESFEVEHKGIRVTSNGDEKVVVSIGDNIRFQVSRTYGSVVGHYLGVYILNKNGLSDNCDGIMGQFIHSDFTADIQDEFDGTEGTLIFEKTGKEVPITNVHRFNNIARLALACWLYKPINADENELLGPRENYIMKSLTSNYNI